MLSFVCCGEGALYRKRHGERDGPIRTGGFRNALPAGAQQVASFEEEKPAVSAARSISCMPIRRPFPSSSSLLGILFFSFIVGAHFFAPLNLSLVLQQVTIIAILGIAQTLVILTAGIDLSVGAIMILSSVVMGRTAVVYGVPVALAFPLGLLVGILAAPSTACWSRCSGCRRSS